MTQRDQDVLVQFALESAADWGREAALIDNETLRGTSCDANRQHRRAVMQEIDSLPRDARGDEARRRFAATYDREIDFSTPEAR
jgi:hypothetical protein